MPKVIAILERDPGRVEDMKSWLDDRLGMYEHHVSPDPNELTEFLAPRLDDVLVLCIGCDSMGSSAVEHDEAGREVADLLVKATEPFPILVHTDEDRSPDGSIIRLMRAGWHVKTIKAEPRGGWVAEGWYPALKRTLREIARHETVAGV